MELTHVAISGASGLVGRALCQRLQAKSLKISRLTRPGSKSRVAGTAEDIVWDPRFGLRDPEQLNGVDAIIHLAGRSIAAARWSTDEKERIRTSRVAATRILVDQICELARPPAVFIGASATGIYGDRGSAPVDEQQPSGDDFLAHVARDWEQACEPLRHRQIRLAHARLGIVMDRSGGALAKVLPLFRWMLGGQLGSGRQYWSWIALHDCVRVLEWLLTTPTALGAYNTVAPQPVTNREFTTALARAVGKPAIWPVPKFGLRLAMGEMADALLLTSCRAVPRRLEQAGFTFDYPELQAFLQTHLQHPEA